MSCYMVEREHIAFLVQAARSRRIGGGSRFYYYHNGGPYYLESNDDGAKLGQMLWDENMKSCNARYPGSEGNPENLPGPIGEDFEFRREDLKVLMHVNPVEVIKACHCYAYQACEHDGWLESASWAFIDSLISAATHALPGYDDAPWGCPE